MRKLFLLIASVLLVFACEKDNSVIDATNDASYVESLEKGPKVDICHNGHIINVSVNAIPAHEMHGDAIDYDGDGYFNAANDCTELWEECDDDPNVNPGMEEICDDGIDNDCDGLIDEDCCPEAEAYCGVIIYDSSGGTADIELYFNADCTVNVVYNFTPCEPDGITWTLIEVDGNTYTYVESDPCGIDGCIVTVIDLGGTLDVRYGCPDPIAGGLLELCE